MKNIIAIIAILLLVSSCQDPTYNGDYYIRNNSNQMLKICLINNGELQDSIILDIGDFSKYTRSDRALVHLPPPFWADSLRVVYNDTIIITHYHKVTGQDVLRNMFSADSWTGGRIGDYEAQYDYIFTDTDYKEALEKE